MTGKVAYRGGASLTFGLLFAGVFCLLHGAFTAFTTSRFIAGSTLGVAEVLQTVEVLRRTRSGRDATILVTELRVVRANGDALAWRWEGRPDLRPGQVVDVRYGPSPLTLHVRPAEPRELWQETGQLLLAGSGLVLAGGGLFRLRRALSRFWRPSPTGSDAAAP